MKTSRITALIPTYNSEKYICDAVESVLAQTHPIDEIIVVDDGSTDGTQRLMARYASRVRYIRQPNAGPPAARNAGLALATGNWIALLDSDDQWLPTKAERQVEYAREHPSCGLVYSDMKTFDDRGIIEESVKICRNLSLPSGHIFRELFAETLFQTSAVFVRKSCVDAVGAFDTSLRMGDDYELFLRIARDFELGYVDEPLVLYRQHAAQGTRTWGKQLQQGTPWEVLVLKKVVDRYPEVIEQLGRWNVDHRLSMPYAALAYASLADGDDRSSRKLIQAALRYWPTNPAYLRYYLMTYLSPSTLVRLKRLLSFSRSRHFKSGDDGSENRWHSAAKSNS